MNERRLFRNRYIQLAQSIKPADLPSLLVRHNAIGLPVESHPACDATHARIRAARKPGWPPRAA